MSAKEKDAYYRAAQAIGKAVAAHPKLAEELPDDSAPEQGPQAADNNLPLRTSAGSNGGYPSPSPNGGSR